MNFTMYAGAFLATVFVVMTVGIASDAIYHAAAPEQPGFAIAVPEDDGAAPAEEEEGLQPIGPLLASADVSNGPSVFRKCQACHNVEAGAGNKTGPNLWGIVNSDVAAAEGFNYSAALVEYAAEGNVWDFEALNRFLAAPGDYIPGTSMGFAGLNREGERADLIAWLAGQADEPVPLPAEGEAPADPDAAADAGEAPSGDEAAAGDAAATDEQAPAEEGDASAAETEAAAEDQAPADDAEAGDDAATGEEAPAADAAGEDETPAEETPPAE